MSKSRDEQEPSTIPAEDVHDSTDDDASDGEKDDFGDTL